MANVDAPFGFKPIRYISGAPYNGAVNPYWIKNTQNNGVFIGDPVIVQGTANTAQIDVPGGTFVPGSLPEVLKTAAGDGNTSTGVIVSFAPDPTALENVHRVDSTERVCYVCDDPDVVFLMQGDSAAVIAVTDVSNNADFIKTHEGSAITGLSAMEVDSGTQSADASNQLIVLRLANIPGNDLTAVHAIWEVMLSNHSMRNAGGGADDGVLGR